jgi:AcrR family transcriptional regulator
VDTVNVTVVERPDTRRRLIDCAVEILDEGGVAALGLREVARRAGVSHNAPSRHFPGGYRELCTAVAADGFAALADALEMGTEAAGAEPEARFAANGRAYIAWAMANRGTYELLWRNDLIEFEDAALATAAARAFTALRDCVAGAQAAGWNAHVDTDELAATCWAWAHGLTHLWSLGALPGPVPPVTLDQLTRTGLDAFSISRKES